MTGVGSATNRRPFCVAVLAAGLAIAAGSQAQAALYYWTDGQPGYYYRPTPKHSQPRHISRHGQTEKTAKMERESAKPQGPLIIAISINQQKLKIYDANGFFAEAPVSTGMHGHPTPMGVFSVIQKQKLHHSNIYSNAPMPYMQRITWSGVAIHAGVLPGYPASHGCIRMPMAFAIKMWNWTRMGARVVVTPGEMMPASFAHPLLPTERVAPQPVAAAESEAGAASPAASIEQQGDDVGCLLWQVRVPTGGQRGQVREQVGGQAREHLAGLCRAPNDVRREGRRRGDARRQGRCRKQDRRRNHGC